MEKEQAKQELQKYFDKYFENICKGEGEIKNVQLYGGIALLRFENGRNYKIEFQYDAPRLVVLDDAEFAAINGEMSPL